MKAGIVGAGAMGSIFAYFFHRSDIEYVIYEKSAETADALKRGLTVDTNETAVTIIPEASTDPGILSDCDIVFLFVKSYSTEEAVQTIKDSLNSNSVVVSLQNGLGNYESIKKHINEERIVYGTTTIGASKQDSSSVRFGGMGRIDIGGKSSAFLEHTSAMLSRAGLRVFVSENPERIIWEKAIINAGINPVASILSVSNGLIPRNRYASEFQKHIVTEAVNVAVSLGINLDRDEMKRRTADVCIQTSANICSMLQDIRNRRKTEIESINGKIIEYGRQNGISVEFNESVYLLVKSFEENYFSGMPVE